MDSGAVWATSPYAQVRGNLNTRIASGEFQTVERVHMPGGQFTTAKIVAAEQEIVSHVWEGRNQVEPVLSRSQALSVADQHQHLNRTQRSVVEDVLSSPDRIQGIQGFAGSGKTTTLSVIRGAAESQGFQVEGFAPTSRAARQLGETGVDAGTLQRFLARSIAPVLPEQKHFYLVDESSLASTNQMREFLSRLAPQDRVLLIGDTRQHQGSKQADPSSSCKRLECVRRSLMRSFGKGSGTQVRCRIVRNGSSLRRGGHFAKTGTRWRNLRCR
jgi:ABC-type glutathione transport system ATPase component